MTCQIMGVLNVTPDSFSDAGRFLDPDAAIERGRQMIAEGADVIDVGGESTRPGADSVDAQEELRRVLPVVEALAPETRVSVDTSKADVARAAVSAGASIINDVSASLAGVAADVGASWIAMHMQGQPRTMQDEPRYDDVVVEVCEYLQQRAAAAVERGVEDVWVDPGIGFGKTVGHNLLLMRKLPAIVATGFPVAIGTSRKSFLAKVTDSDGPQDRLESSVATAVWAMTQGVSMVRVHDVEATVRAARLVQSGAAA